MKAFTVVHLLIVCCVFVITITSLWSTTKIVVFAFQIPPSSTRKLTENKKKTILLNQSSNDDNIDTSRNHRQRSGSSTAMIIIQQQQISSSYRIQQLRSLYLSLTTNTSMSFETIATSTMKQIKQYIIQQIINHKEEPFYIIMKQLGLVIPGKLYPILHHIQEEYINNNNKTTTLIWTLIFESIDIPYKMWIDERRKYHDLFQQQEINIVKIDTKKRLIGIQFMASSFNNTNDNNYDR